MIFVPQIRWLKLVDEYYALVEVKVIVCIVEIVELNAGIVLVVCILCTVCERWRHFRKHELDPNNFCKLCANSYTSAQFHHLPSSSPSIFLLLGNGFQ